MAFTFSAKNTFWIIFGYKAIIGQLPSYLSAFMSTNNSQYSLCSSRFIKPDVPIVRSEYVKAAFSYNAASTWNGLQKHLKVGAVYFLE
ncbi:hypothetical protein AOLI_G00015600 [Acnodon oligacanthus]